MPAPDNYPLRCKALCSSGHWFALAITLNVSKKVFISALSWNSSVNLGGFFFAETHPSSFQSNLLGYSCVSNYNKLCIIWAIGSGPSGKGVSGCGGRNGDIKGRLLSLRL